MQTLNWLRAQLAARPYIWLAAGVLGALALGWMGPRLVMGVPRLALLAAGAGAAALAWVYLWRLPLHRLMTVFTFLVVMTAYVPLTVPIADLNLRTSQVFLPLVLVRLYAAGAFRRASPWPLALTVAGGVLGGSFLFWTIANLADLPSVVGSLGRVLLLGINLVTALAIYLLIARTGAWRSAVQALVVSVGIFNLLLVVLAVIVQLGVPGLRFWVASTVQPLLEGGVVTTGDALRFRGGIIAGNLSVVALGLILAQWLEGGVLKRRLLALAALAAAGILLGFSRQSVVSMAGVLLVMGAHLLRQGRVLRLMRLAIVFVGLTGLVGVVVSQLPLTRPFYQAFIGRAALLLQPRAYETGTVGERLEMWTSMLSDVAANPFVGAGQDAYLQYYPAPGGGGSHNFALEILHAAGLGGFIPYLLIHGAVGWAAWQTLQRWWLPQSDRLLFLGCLGGYVAVVLASLTNLIFSNPSYWLIVGLLAGSTVVVRRAHRLARGAARLRPAEVVDGRS